MPEQTRNKIAVRLEQSPVRARKGQGQKGEGKISRNPVTFDPDQPILRKPPWIRIRLPGHNRVEALKARLRENHLVTVCEEASCPNIHECF
ncbi:MAG: lipoyl synthase, partial [Gammaproteobacteria bacterium]